MEDSGALLNAWSGSPATHLPAVAEISLPHTAAVASSQGQLLGREQEMAWLEAALCATHQEANARMLLLEGEPGMGKSSLLDNFAAKVQQSGAHLLRADAFEAELIRPFAMWNDAMRSAPALELKDLFSGEERVEREQLFANLNSIVSSLTQQKPLVILFDDMQWCDESSAAVLHYILRSNRQLPLLLVAAARTSELRDNGPVVQTLSGLRHDQLLQERRLQALDQSALVALIQQQAPDADSERLSQ